MTITKAISKVISKVVVGFDFKGHFKGFVNVRHFKGEFQTRPDECLLRSTPPHVNMHTDIGCQA